MPLETFFVYLIIFYLSYISKIDIFSHHSNDNKTEILKSFAYYLAPNKLETWSMLEPVISNTEHDVFSTFQWWVILRENKIIPVDIICS